jgi:peptidoglycan/LPS O-acetylase OafA/YrhL
VSKAPSERLFAIDLVRLLSIAVVMAVHLHASGVAALPAHPLLREAWVNFARNGSYGVSLFFVVSGFVITRTILKRDPDLARLDRRGFYARRAGRILPLLLLVLLLGALALATVAGPGPRTAFCLRDPVARFDLPFWLSLPSFSFNWLRLSREASAYGFGLHWDVLWSLAIEEQFYLFYPLLLRRLGHVRPVARFLAAVVVAGFLWRLACGLLAPQRLLLSFIASFGAFDLIAMGALLCLFVEAHPSGATGTFGRLEALLGVAGALVVAATYRFSSLDQAMDRAWGPTAIGLGLTVFLAVALRRGWLARPLFGWLSLPGQWSYGGYLFHAGALFALWPLLAGRDAAFGFLLYVATTLGVAGLVYRFFEVTANRAVRRALSAA